jgi:Flp pilus assembly protein TadG
MRMRKALVGAAAVLLAIVVVLLAAAGVDFGTSIYAEYRLARAVRQTANLGFDPLRRDHRVPAHSAGDATPL